MSNDLLQKDLEKIYSECFMDKDFGHLFFLGVLAYPALKDKNHVMNFVFSVLSEKSKAMAEYFHKRYFIDKGLKGFEWRKAKRNIEHIFDIRIPRRMEAVLVALNTMNLWEENITQSVERITCKKYEFEEEAGDHTNIFKLSWKESMPVLHMALALFPMLNKNLYLFDNKPELLSFEILNDLKNKGIREVERKLKREVVIPIEDLFLLSSDVRKQQKIENEIDLIANGKWLTDILKIAEAWSFLLPGLIHTIQKEDLYRIKPY